MGLVLSSILKYFSSRSPLRVAFDFAMMSMFVAWLGLVYFSANNYETAVSIWNALRHDAKIVDVRSATVLNTKINAELGTVLDRIGADRISLSKYHNGRRGLDGIHFVFSSRVNEVVASGVSSEFRRTQSLPVSFFIQSTAKLVREGCYANPEMTEQNTGTYAWWRDLGTSAVIECAVLGTGGEVVGFVSGEWLEPIHADQINASTAAIRDVAARLSLLLSLQ